jgi:hypothetical protein
MHRALLIAPLLFCAVAPAEERTYVYRDRTIRYSVTVFDPPLPARPDPARMNQETAVNTVILFRSRLQAGNLEGASKLTTDPARFMDTYTKYRARVGEAVYREQLARLGSADSHFRCELVVGGVHALMTEGGDGVAHYLRFRDGRYWLDSPDFVKGHLPKEVEDLSDLVNEIAAGKLKIRSAR